jgi:hypothetical protein
MAVVGYAEVATGTSVSGKYGESLRLTRKFIVRVDNPNTSKALISAAPGVAWGAPHPDVAACRAMEFELSPHDDVAMLWIHTITYYVPPAARNPDANGVPHDAWEAGGGTSTAPAVLDKFGDSIVNSAGDALDGLEKEESEFSFTLTKFYQDDTWAQDARDYSNSCNSDAWGDGDPLTWKCEFRSAAKRVITPADPTLPEITVVETKWEFRYDKTTWKLKPWDVGFMQKVDANGDPNTLGDQRATIIGNDGKAVKQPVALENGVAKVAGLEPDVINNGDGVEVYESRQFVGKFGHPFIIGVPPIN